MGQHSDVTLDIQRAVLSLCMETYAPGTEVEIDGIICMLETQSKEYKVVKIHKTFVMSDFSVSTSTRTFQDDIVARNSSNPRDDERIAKSFPRMPQDTQHRRADLMELPYHESEKSDRGKEMSRGTQRNRILNLRPDDQKGLENYSYTMMHPLHMDTGSGIKSSKMEVASRKLFQNSSISPSNNRNIKNHQKQNRTAPMTLDKSYQAREVSKDLLIVVNQEAENLRQKSLTTHDIDSEEILGPETSEIILSENTDHTSERTDKGCSPSGKMLAMNTDTNGHDIKMHASFANKSFVNDELAKTVDGNDDDDCIFIKSEPVRATECDRSYVEIAEARKTDPGSEKGEDPSPKNVSRTLWQQPDGSLIPCSFGTVDMCKNTSGMLLTTSVRSDTTRTAVLESLAASCSQGTSHQAEAMPTEEQQTHISYDRDKILNSGAFDDSIVSQTIMYSEMQNDGILGVVSKIDASFFSPVRRGRKPCPTAPFSCERCGFRFAHRSTLHRHVKFNCGSARVACDICGKHLQRRPDAMRLHKSQVHGITEMLSMVKGLQNESNLDC